ncbi:MAG: FtsX-like permease family protein [Candidatus Aminicenantes bacterium]|nr:FtsX-like permease family protein [Candidatus Aminicenantes bacterium]
MLKNYLKIAWRNLLRNKAYSFINILGLAIGIAASVLIFLYLRDETGYDRYHAKSDRIYRITADWSNKGDSRIHQLGTPSILARTLRMKYPQAESVAQFYGPLGDTFLKKGESGFKVVDAYGAEPYLFDIFSFPLVQGDSATALSEPNTAVLAESLAAKVFGGEVPLGRQVEVQVANNTRRLKVTGVTRDVPRNSHFRYDLLISMSTFFTGQEQGWTNNNFTTYLLLRPGVTRAKMEETLVELERTDMAGRQAHMPWVWTLVPVAGIHLDSDLATGNQPNGNRAYVRLFGWVAALVLLIAGVNFVNLSTARSARRAREVGIRKTVGSARSQLVRQFLGESILLSLLALVLAVAVIQLALPLFRNVTGNALALAIFGDPTVIPALLGLALVVGILAGLYPALYLSSIRQADVLKGSALAGKRRGALRLRHVLVVFQFAMSILLILGSRVISGQLDFIRSRDLGFDKDQVLFVRNAEILGGQLDAFKDKLRRNPAVVGVSTARAIPGQRTVNWGIGVEGVGRERPLNMNFLSCDEDFADVLSIRMAEGRFLSREFPSDKEAVVINRKAADYFGLADPVGKKLQIWSTRKTYTIIGVMENVHFESLHRDVIPMGYLLPEAVNSTRRPYLFVKVNLPRMEKLLPFIRTSWDEVVPSVPFEYGFLDERVESLYRGDVRAGKIVSAFSVLAIFVSCLGLFGLAAYVTEQRTKEIGIRKVLGARLPQIVWILAGQFLKWVAVAAALAWPVGYWLAGRWLQGFAFRTGLSAGVFLASGLAAAAIAVLSVSSQVIKSARTDPVKSLKYE